MSSEAGSAQANVALVVESVEALNAGDTERLLSVMAPDVVMHLAEFPEPPVRAGAFKQEHARTARGTWAKSALTASQRAGREASEREGASPLKGHPLALAQSSVTSLAPPRVVPSSALQRGRRAWTAPNGDLRDLVLHSHSRMSEEGGVNALLICAARALI